MKAAEERFHSGDEPPPPSNRKFGVLFTVVFLLLGAVPWAYEGHFTAWPWMASGVFLVLSLAVPATLGPLNRLWMRFGMLLHHIVSPLVLGIMFYAMIVPIGLVMRLFGKRPIPVDFEPGRESYWVERTPPGPGPDSLRNQF